MPSPASEGAGEILDSTCTKRSHQHLISHHHGYITEAAQQQESLFYTKSLVIMLLLLPGVIDNHLIGMPIRNKRIIFENLEKVLPHECL